MNFLRNLLAAIIGCLIAFGICFFMLIIFISLLGNMEDTVVVKSNSVLELQLQKPINDYTGDDAADPFTGFFQQAQSLDAILHAIEVAKTDDKIKGISIKSNYLLAGWAQTKEIRMALEDFKENGKFVYSFSDYYLQKDYYLSSVADRSHPSWKIQKRRGAIHFQRDERSQQNTNFGTDRIALELTGFGHFQ